MTQTNKMTQTEWVVYFRFAIGDLIKYIERFCVINEAEIEEERPYQDMVTRKLSQALNSIGFYGDVAWSRLFVQRHRLSIRALATTIRQFCEQWKPQLSVLELTESQYKRLDHKLAQLQDLLYAGVTEAHCGDGLFGIQR